MFFTSWLEDRELKGKIKIALNELMKDNDKAIITINGNKTVKIPFNTSEEEIEKIIVDNIKTL